METICDKSTVMLVHNVFPGPLGGAVFMGKNESDQKIVAVLNYKWNYKIPSIGEVWKIEGERNPPESKYPKSVKVKKAIPVLPPEGNLTRWFLLSSPYFRRFGLGDVKLSLLEKSLLTNGVSLYRALNEERYDLLSKSLPHSIVHNLIGVWKLLKNNSEVYQFLALYDFDINMANHLLKIQKENTANRIKENPYRLVSCIPERRSLWKKIDKAARALGIDKKDPKRLSAAVEQVLYDRLNYGHTLTHITLMKSSVLRLLNSKSNKVFEKAIMYAASQKLVVKCGCGFQAIGPAVMETIVEKRLNNLAIIDKNPSQVNFPLFDNALLDREITKMNLEFTKKFENGFNASQLRLIKTVCTSNLSCVTGGFCTGKTTILWAINRIMEKAGKAIYQLALENSGKNSLEKATGRRAYMIDEFIEIFQKFSENSDKINSLSVKEGALIVIDDASRVNLSTFFRLLRVLPERIRICLVGDPYQLPPVGFGVIFQRLVDMDKIQTIELATFVGGNDLAEFARVSREVRCGIVPKRLSFKNKSAEVCFIMCNETEILKTLFEISSNLNHDCQILTTRQQKGLSCSNKINRFFQHRLVDSMDYKKKVRGWPLFLGDRVLLTNNSHKLGLFKGDIGKVIKISMTESPVFRFSDKDYKLTDENILELGIELAYAINVYKAQCSKYKKIVLPVTLLHGLDRSLIYTAITLAQEQVLFVGSWNVFRAAIKTDSKVSTIEVGFDVDEATAT